MPNFEEGILDEYHQNDAHLKKDAKLKKQTVGVCFCFSLDTIPRLFFVLRSGGRYMHV